MTFRRRGRNATGLSGIITAFVVIASLGAGFAASDLSVTTQGEIRILQERLREAGCYSGPVEGVASQAVVDAAKRCPVMKPILSIEAGTHTAPIKDIGVDRACRQMVTGSRDKTVRLWSLPDGRLLRTLRPPIGPDYEGRVYTVALSPDGALVAVGGWDAHWSQGNAGVYLFETQTGALKARIGAFPNVIDNLAFSRDGRLLAVGVAKGIRIIDVQSHNEVGADKTYGDYTYGASFDGDGRLFTVALDGLLRAYDPEFNLIGTAETRGGKEPFRVEADPSGQYVAVGFSDTTKIDVYRASDLTFLYAADTAGIDKGNLAEVTWSSDGTRLVAGGSYKGSGPDGNSGVAVVVWDDRGRGQRQIQPVSDNLITAIKRCGEGFAVGASDPLLALLDRAGKPIYSRPSSIVDQRYKLGDAFQVSNDGRRVRFGLDYGAARPVLFDLSRMTLSQMEDSADLASPRVHGLPVTDWERSYMPRIAGKPIRLEPHELAYSLAISPNARQFVLGTNWSLRSFDAKGRAQWRKPAPSDTAGVSITGDGRLVVAAYGDGTIRWHRMSDGEELLALFVHKNDLRWVAWTPSGYFAASPGGEDLIGWHVNRGWNQAADFFAVSRFRDQFNRPDIVQKILVTLDETKAVADTNRAAGVRSDPIPIEGRLPPVIRILSPAEGTSVREREVTIEYELRSPSGLPVDVVEVQIDGRPSRGIKRIDADTSGIRRERQTVTIPQHDVRLGLVARAGALASAPAQLRLRWGATTDLDNRRKPKLYGVIVGVSTYRDAALQLRYAAKDARDFATALMAQKGGLYEDVELKVLTDEKATTDAVKRALGWLEDTVSSRDIGLVFLAGHGVSDAKNRYFFLTADADREGLADSALEGVTLRERTRALAGKALVFLDTCHAGAAMAGARGTADINSVVNELSTTENGVVTFASSTGREVSQEDDSWGNGAFTKALIEGLPGSGRKGRADLFGTGTISTTQLNAWLADRVKELTRGAQSPVMILPATIADFPLFTAAL